MPDTYREPTSGSPSSRLPDSALASQGAEPTRASSPGNATEESHESRGLPWVATLDPADLLASVTVFLVALPLCLGIAVASGMPPAAGIVSGFVGGVLVGCFAGCPLQVTGPAAGVAVMVEQTVHDLGVGGLGVVVLLAGAFQILAGRARLGRWFQAVSPSVVEGMLAGIGVLIMAGQVHVALDRQAQPSALRNLVALPDALLQAVTGAGATGQAGLVALVTLLVLLGWPRLAADWARVLPTPLVAITAGTVLAHMGGFAVRYVDVPARLPQAFTFPGLESLGLLEHAHVWTAALAMAFVMSAETLLSAAAVDRRHHGERTRFNQELVSQGMGNVLCGLLGVLPVTGVIARSGVNLEAGGKTRASTMLHGMWLLLTVLSVPGLLKLVPVSALATLLVLTGSKLANPLVWSRLRRHGRRELIIFAWTFGGVVTTDLLHGVLLGVLVSVVMLLYFFVRLEVRLEQLEAQVFKLHLAGAACFATLPQLATALESVPAGSTLLVDAVHIGYVDAACLEYLEEWAHMQEHVHGRLVVDWQELRATPLRLAWDQGA
jgi:MFS superfamily sulfate permease-like transporter